MSYEYLKLVNNSTIYNNVMFYFRITKKDEPAKENLTSLLLVRLKVISKVYTPEFLILFMV